MTHAHVSSGAYPGAMRHGANGTPLTHRRDKRPGTLEITTCSHESHRASPG